MGLQYNPNNNNPNPNNNPNIITLIQTLTRTSNP
jgi:hypothetical protein